MCLAEPSTARQAHGVRGQTPDHPGSAGLHNVSLSGAYGGIQTGA